LPAALSGQKVRPVQNAEANRILGQQAIGMKPVEICFDKAGFVDFDGA
jgi:hypothetical protein